MIQINTKNINNTLDESLAKLNQGSKTGTIIYTAIFGDFDNLNEVKNPNPRMEYIFFTDRTDLTSKTWEIIRCKDLNNDYRLFAKIFKIFPHKIFRNANQSLWIDGNYSINKNHSQFFEKYNGIRHINFYRHSLRNCIYDEAKIIQRDKPEFDPLIITKQINRYKNEQMPSNQGLINGAIILRNHESELLSKLMDDWWFEIYNYSIRDQISFNYVNWKNGNFVKYFSEEITNFLYFTYKPHLNSKNSGIFLEIKVFIKSSLGRVKSYVRNNR